MRDKSTLCSTCLSTDRFLVPLNKIASIIQEIHFTELNQCTGGICWECRIMMMKYHRFKKKAQAAQEMLSLSQEYCNLQTLSSLTSKINFNYDYEYIYKFDPLTNCTASPKSEPDSIKQEYIYQSDDNLYNTSDVEEKVTKDIEKIKKVFIGVIETKYNKDIDDNKIQNDFNVIKKLSQTENVYAETIETKPNKNFFKKAENRLKRENATVKRKVISTEIDEKEIQEKFVEVTLTEEEMARVREEKRNHPNFKKIPYKCDSCVLGFTRKDTYTLHMNKKHNESIGEYACDVCSIRFPNKLSVSKHIKKHFVCYRCRLCRYEAHELWSAVNHCKVKHGADAPDRIHCSQCDAIVKTPEDLEKHIQTQHTLYCNECGVKFKGKNTLRRHMARIHAVKRDFICDVCSKTFITKTRLESHMVKHNASIAKKLAYCHICNIQYKDIYGYRNHLKSSANHSERAYPCPECNKKFASKVYWTKHYNFYHLHKSQYNCEICNKLFISKWRLKNHKQKHHGLSRSRDHPCNVCSKKFFTLATLRSHQLTHSDQRSYMCEDCGDTFKQRAALYTHTRLVHRGGGRRK